MKLEFGVSLIDENGETTNDYDVYGKMYWNSLFSSFTFLVTSLASRGKSDCTALQNYPYWRLRLV